MVKHASLLVGMFAVTSLVVGFETGCLMAGMKVACVTSPLKYGVAAVHSYFWRKQHGPRS